MTVDARDFAFQPADLSIAPGDTVTWVNRDPEAHAVQGGPMNSPDVPPGGSWSHTFDSVGEYSYVCRIHTYMTGVVRVATGGGSTTSTTAPATTTSAPATTTTAPSGSTTTTSSPSASTSTTAPGPGGPTTTTTTAAPSGPGFQDVPDDPSARRPPGTAASPTTTTTAAPSGSTTTTAAPASTTTTAPGGGGFQEVPDDPDDGDPPAGAAGDETASGDAEPGAAGEPLGDGTVLAPFEEHDGVKVFRLELAPTRIEVSPGVMRDAYAFNGVVPGPVLRVNEGDRVRFLVKNSLPVATGVHWHGMILPVDQDGVPGLTQPFIEPGGTYTYEWTAVATGTHWYHSHSSGRHIGKGLYGMLEVVPKAGDIIADRDYRIMLGDTDLGFTLNGRSFPSTTRLAAKVGEQVRLRVVNAGDQVHAMHLHGTTFKVVAQDGMPRAVPESMDTLTISPGQTFDLLASPPNEGPWLLHCHIFAHSHESHDGHEPGATGMNGMVTVLDVAPGSGGPLGIATGFGAELDGGALAAATSFGPAVVLLLLLASAGTYVAVSRATRRRLAAALIPDPSHRKDTH